MRYCSPTIFFTPKSLHRSISSPESPFPSDTWCRPKGSQPLGTRLYTDWSQWRQLVVDSHKLLLVTSKQQTANSGYRRQSASLNLINLKQWTHTPTHGFVKPTALLVPHAWAQPYHPGSDTHGQRFRPYRGSSALHNRRTSVRTKSCWWAPIRAKQLAMAACPGDTAVRIREVLARPWVGECVPLTLSLSLSIWRLKSGHCTSAVSKSHLQGTKTQISCG